MTTEDEGAARPKQPENPYTIALLVVSAAALLLAAILAGAGANAQASSTSYDDGTTQFALAQFFSIFGLVAGLLWLLVSALTWKQETQHIR